MKKGFKSSDCCFLVVEKYDNDILLLNESNKLFIDKDILLIY